MAKLGNLLSDIPSGRLTLTTGVPVTTSDVTAATTLYYTPYIGNKISLYNGYEWLFHEFDELSLSLSGYTADTNYDIFMYDSSGTLTLESTAWSTATARATEITRLEGIYTKSGSATRRYLGTIRTTGTIGQCEDSEAKRFCWNYYNYTGRVLSKMLTSYESHSYAIATWRAWNNSSTSTKIEFVIGIAERPITVSGTALAVPDGSTYIGRIGVGCDSITTIAGHGARIGNSGAGTQGTCTGTMRATLSVGYHYCILMENISTGQCTFYSGGTGTEQDYISGIYGLIYN